MNDKPLKRYVHVTNRERVGFVEFNFSINDPSLFLEMILPLKAFDDFCHYNDVTFLSEEQIRLVEQQHNKWNSGDVNHVPNVQDNS